jgi:tRNA threonylcarbamoyladenosine biosynthesis protein TsaE
MDSSTDAPLTLRLRGADATQQAGRALGSAVAAGTVITLDGDLGTGKTTLVRGIAEGLGIHEGVASPTYLLMQAHGGGRLPLAHFDAWMEGREKALLADGADELLRSDGVAVIEWAGRVQEWIQGPRLALILGHETPETRLLTARIVPDGGETGDLEPLLRALGEVGAELVNP